MSAPRTAAVLILLPLREAGQQTSYVTRQARARRGRSVVEIHSWAGQKIKNAAEETSAVKIPLLGTPKPNLVQWSSSLADSSRLEVSSQVGMCVNV